MKQPTVANPPRRFVLACASGIVASSVVFWWMVTEGTWKLLQPEGFSGNFFDVQALALLHGHLQMPASVLKVEGFREGTNTFMYFGPVPALLRVPVLLFTHSLDGRLSEVYLLAAFVLALVFVAHLLWGVRRLVAPSTPVSTGEAAFTGLAIMGIGIGSVLFFLGTAAVVYHEAAAWADAFAVGSFSFLIRFLTRPSRWSLVLSGAFATLSILSRVTVGAGPVVALLLLAIAHLTVAARRRWHRRSASSEEIQPPLSWIGLAHADHDRTWSLGLLVAACLPLFLSVLVNEIKFHTFFSVPYAKQMAAQVNPAEKLALAHNGGSLFGLKYVLTNLSQYFRPDALGFSRLFPWVNFPALPTPIGHLFYVGLTPTSSVPSAMPAIFLLGLVGVIAVARSGRKSPTLSVVNRGAAPSLRILSLPIIGAACGTLEVVAFAGIAYRHLADFIPLLALTGTAGFYTVVFSPARRHMKGILTGVLLILVIFGMWTNVALSVLYQRELDPNAPISLRQQFVSFQEDLDQHLFGNPPTGVTKGRHLPRPGSAGSLAIVGDCAGLYQSDGKAWRAVEQATGAGHFRFQVVFPSAPSPGQYWPLLVRGTKGAGSFLAVRPVGDQRFQFAYRFGKRWLTGSTVRLPAGQVDTVDVVLDPNIHEEAISVNGTSVYSYAYRVRLKGRFEVAHDTIGGPVAASFPGKIRLLRVRTPICNSLRAGLAAK